MDSETKLDFVEHCYELFTKCYRTFDRDEFRCLQSLFSRIKRNHSDDRIQMAIHILDDLEGEIEIESEEQQALYNDVFASTATDFDMNIRAVLETEFVR